MRWICRFVDSFASSSATNPKLTMTWINIMYEYGCLKTRKTPEGSLLPYNKVCPVWESETNLIVCEIHKKRADIGDQHVIRQAASFDEISKT